MKTNLRLLTLAVALCVGFTPPAIAADKHEHLPGPKGGRLFEKTQPHAEFFVEKDHTVTITFYDAKLQPVPAGGQSVTVHATPKGGKAVLEFEKKGDVLVSKGKLPAGDGYNVVVQLSQTAGARPQNFRFKLEMHSCGECKRAEYACTCDH